MPALPRLWSAPGTGTPFSVSPTNLFVSSVLVLPRDLRRRHPGSSKYLSTRPLPIFDLFFFPTLICLPSYVSICLIKEEKSLAPNVNYSPAPTCARTFSKLPPFPRAARHFFLPSSLLSRLPTLVWTCPYFHICLAN